MQMNQRFNILRINNFSISLLSLANNDTKSCNLKKTTNFIK